MLRIVRATPDVAAADAVPESEMRRTLERWLGPAAQSDELPVPALVNFDVKPGADLGAIRQRVTNALPGATIAAHREVVGPLLRSLRLLQWVAFGLVLLLSAAASAAVVLAARGALDTHRFTIEVMHGIGATDVQVTHLFQRKIAIDALFGSIAGAAVAGFVLLAARSGSVICRRADGRRDRFPGRPVAPAPASAGADRPSDLGCAHGCSRGTAQGAMIARFASLVLLLYPVGFVLFAFTLGHPAAANAAADRRGGGPDRRQRPDRACA